MYQDFHISSTCIPSPTIHIPHQTGTSHATALMHHQHSQFKFHRAHSSSSIGHTCCTFHSFDQCTMTCMHHYSILQNTLTDLKLLLGRETMTNLNSILKIRDITLLIKVHIVKAMVFPVVMYRCEGRIIKDAEH